MREYDCEFRLNFDRAVPPSVMGKLIGPMLRGMTNADGAPVAPSQLARSRSSGFSVAASECEFSYHIDADSSLGSFIAQGPLSSEGLLDKVLQAVLGSDFRHRLSNGSTANWHQCFWDNAESLQLYEHFRRPLDGLVLVDNGLPYPLSGVRVDTSKAPARRVLRRQFVEQVGPRMWLGPHLPFKVDVNALRRIDGVETWESDEVLAVRVTGCGPFDVVDASMLDRLRAATFPTRSDVSVA